MKLRVKIAFVAIAISVVGGLSGAQTPAVATQTSPSATADPVMKLADATPVFLRTKEWVSSATASVGDRVPFRVTEDVKLGGLIVIHRGAEAWGVVTAVKRKARKGLAGRLDISVQSAQLLTGSLAPLRAEEHLKGIGRSMKSDSAEALGESMGLALPLLPLVRLEKGKDVSLDADVKVTAYVNGDVVLDRTALERAQPPTVHRTGPATVTIFRPRLSSGSLNAPSLYCGKVTLTRLWNGRYLKLQLPPGRYSLQGNDGHVVELGLGEGQETYVEVQMTSHGIGMQAHMVRVSDGEGEDEVAHLRAMDAKEVIKISDVPLADLQAPPPKK